MTISIWEFPGPLLTSSVI